MRKFFSSSSARIDAQNRTIYIQPSSRVIYLQDSQYQVTLTLISAALLISRFPIAVAMPTGYTFQLACHNVDDVWLDSFHLSYISLQCFSQELRRSSRKDRRQALGGIGSSVGQIAPSATRKFQRVRLNNTELQPVPEWLQKYLKHVLFHRQMPISVRI